MTFREAYAKDMEAVRVGEAVINDVLLKMRREAYNPTPILKRIPSARFAAAAAGVVMLIAAAVIIPSLLNNAPERLSEQQFDNSVIADAVTGDSGESPNYYYEGFENENDEAPAEFVTEITAEAEEEQRYWNRANDGDGSDVQAAGGGEAAGMSPASFLNEELEGLDESDSAAFYDESRVNETEATISESIPAPAVTYIAEIDPETASDVPPSGGEGVFGSTGADDFIPDSESGANTIAGVAPTAATDVFIGYSIDEFKAFAESGEAFGIFDMDLSQYLYIPQEPLPGFEPAYIRLSEFGFISLIYRPTGYESGFDFETDMKNVASYYIYFSYDAPEEMLAADIARGYKTIGENLLYMPEYYNDRLLGHSYIFNQDGVRIVIWLPVIDDLNEYDMIRNIIMIRAFE